MDKKAYKTNKAIIMVDFNKNNLLQIIKIIFSNKMIASMGKNKVGIILFNNLNKYR